jgi:hypothetical protein
MFVLSYLACETSPFYHPPRGSTDVLRYGGVQTLWVSSTILTAWRLLNCNPLGRTPALVITSCTTQAFVVSLHLQLHRLRAANGYTQ